MTLIVEDGSIVEDANSYVDTADLSTYAANRGVTLSGDAEQLLIQAMDYLESLSYQGAMVSSEQELQWPRSGVYVNGFAVGSDEIPKQLKNGQMITAIAIDEGNGPQSVGKQALKRKKIDVMEWEYQDGTSTSKIDPKIFASLRLLLSGGGGSFSNPVVMN